MSKPDEDFRCEDLRKSMRSEGIWRFVRERNQVQADRDRPALAATLVARKILSAECADAFTRSGEAFATTFIT